jgi:5'-nucleotidase
MRWLCALLVAACGSSSAPATPDAHVADLTTVRILAFNDFHGALAASSTIAPPAPGAAALAGAIAARRNANTLVVSAGDLIGASPLISGLYHDEPTIDAMNLIRLDYNGVGNHEFDEGTAELERMQHGGCHPTDGCAPGGAFTGATFQFLAANVTDGSGATIFPGFMVRDIDGARIAIVGETLRDTPGATLASEIPELMFADEADTVRALVPAIEAAGAKIIVVLVHQGGSQAGGINDCLGLTGAIGDIADRMPDAVVLVLSAHTHHTYNCQRGTRTVTSAGANGAYLTVADLQIDRTTQTVASMTVENVAVGTDPPDSAVADLVATWDQTVAPLRDRVVATITADIANNASLAGELPTGDVVADAMRAGTGAPLALMNSGGLRAPLTFARSGNETADGQVTYGEAFALQPFANVVSTVTLSGADLVATLDAAARSGNPLQVSGFTYTWHPTLTPEVTAADVLIGGQPVGATDQLHVAVNSIVLASLPTATDLHDVGIDLDLLVAYLGAASPLAPPAPGRIAIGL